MTLELLQNELLEHQTKKLFHHHEIKRIINLIQKIIPNERSSYYWMYKPKLKKYTAKYYRTNAEKIKLRRKERYWSDKPKYQAEMKKYYLKKKKERELNDKS